MPADHVSLRGLLFRPTQSFFVLLVFFANTIGPLPPVQAQEFRLPAPGTMVHLSPAFNPPILKGLKVHPDNPFRFDFILDQGDTKDGVIARSEATKQSLKEQSIKLIKYFLASLTIPERDLWVNLSPYEKNRIIPQSFGLTEMGRDLLAEDYLLKQITASLIYPEDQTGKKFWKRVYEEAAQKFGTTNVPVNTFNKVWIVPEKAVVYENAKAGTAYVVEAKLKVMLEQDYISLTRHSDPERSEGEESKGTLRSFVAKSAPQDDMARSIIREIVIPELTKEVNFGQNFAQLRQVYNSLILAVWYKKKIKSSILAQVYADKNKVAGILSSPNALVGDPESIYQRYLQSFKKGAYNYIKEEIDPATQQFIPRKYFSGGANLWLVDPAMRTTFDLPQGIDVPQEMSNLEDLSIRFDPVAEETWKSTPHMITHPGRLSDITQAIKIISEELGRKAEVWNIGIGWDAEKGPVTVTEMAEQLGETAHVLGIDNKIPSYQVKVPNTEMLFDADGNLLSALTSGGFLMQIKDGSKVIENSKIIFQRIVKLGIGPHNPLLRVPGLEIVYKPTRLYERENLSFVSADVFHLHADLHQGYLLAHQADIVFMANVMVYQNFEDVPEALIQLLPFVHEGGKVFIGGNRAEKFKKDEYIVYEKRGNKFVLTQYAFAPNFHGLMRQASKGNMAPYIRTAMGEELFRVVRNDHRYAEMALFSEKYPEKLLNGQETDIRHYKETLSGVLKDALAKVGIVSAMKGPVFFIDIHKLFNSRLGAIFAEDFYFLKSQPEVAIDQAMLGRLALRKIEPRIDIETPIEFSPRPDLLSGLIYFGDSFVGQLRLNHGLKSGLSFTNARALLRWFRNSPDVNFLYHRFRDWDHLIEASSYLIFGKVLSEEQFVEKLDSAAAENDPQVQYGINAAHVAFNSLFTLAGRKRMRFDFRELWVEYRAGVDAFNKSERTSLNPNGRRFIDIRRDLDGEYLKRVLWVALDQIPNPFPPPWFWAENMLEIPGNIRDYFNGAKNAHELELAKDWILFECFDYLRGAGNKRIEDKRRKQLEDLFNLRRNEIYPAVSKHAPAFITRYFPFTEKQIDKVLTDIYLEITNYSNKAMMGRDAAMQSIEEFTDETPIDFSANPRQLDVLFYFADDFIEQLKIGSPIKSRDIFQNAADLTGYLKVSPGINNLKTYQRFGNWERILAAASYLIFGSILTERQFIEKLDETKNDPQIQFNIDAARTVFNVINTVAINNGYQFIFRDLLPEYHKRMGFNRAGGVVNSQTGGKVVIERYISADILKRALRIALDQIPGDIHPANPPESIYIPVSNPRTMLAEDLNIFDFRKAVLNRSNKARRRKWAAVAAAAVAAVLTLKVINVRERVNISETKPKAAVELIRGASVDPFLRTLPFRFEGENWTKDKVEMFLGHLSWLKSMEPKNGTGKIEYVLEQMREGKLKITLKIGTFPSQANIIGAEVGGLTEIQPGVFHIYITFDKDLFFSNKPELLIGAVGSAFPEVFYRFKERKRWPVDRAMKTLFPAEKLMMGTPLWEEFKKMNHGKDPKTVYLAGEERTIVSQIHPMMQNIPVNDMVYLSISLQQSNGAIDHIVIVDYAKKIRTGTIERQDNLIPTHGKRLEDFILKRNIHSDEYLFSLIVREIERQKYLDFELVALGDNNTKNQLRNRGLMKKVFSNLESTLKINYPGWAILGIPLDRTTVDFMKRFGAEEPNAMDSVVEGHIPDKAMRGGIDFNSDKMDLQLQNGGQAIKFHIDPAQLAELQDTSGFRPVIINIQPLTDLKGFLTSASCYQLLKSGHLTAQKWTGKKSSDFMR